MAVRLDCVVLALLLAQAVILFTACSRRNASPEVAPSRAGTPITAAAGSAPTSATVNASEAPRDTPVAGASFQIGTARIVVERFRARVSAPNGVNLRSSPEIKPDNRVGSLPSGAIVDVEGRVPAGQEAEPGHGTTWYFLGVVGTTPQYIYGAAGTIEPLTGSATPQGTSIVSGTPLVPPPLPPSATP